MNYSIEPLESRIAPAAIVSDKTVIFTDYDGDTAAVTITNAAGQGYFGGADGSANANTLLEFNAGTGGVDGHVTANQQLMAIRVSSLELPTDGINIAVSVLRQNPDGGDGSVSVGFIEAGTPAEGRYNFHSDVGSVYIQGDLISIDAGDQYIDTALNWLDVQSMGVLKMDGNTVVDPRASLLNTDADGASSDIFGPIGSFHVHGEVRSSISVTGVHYGSITSLQIDGALSGDVSFTGTLVLGVIHSITGGKILGYKPTDAYPGGAINSLTVLGDVIGGSTDYSGLIQGTSIYSVSIGGSLVGGSGAHSGAVYSEGLLGGVAIYGDLIGGSGTSSGSIGAASGIVYTTVVGDVAGGKGSYSGSIHSSAAYQIVIYGDLIGGKSETSGVSHNGSIQMDGALNAIFVLGNVVGGTDARSGWIEAGSLNAVAIGGSIAGNSGPLSGGIYVNGDIGAATIYGDVIGGTNNLTGLVYAGGSMGQILLYGDLRGNGSTSSAVTYSGAIEVGGNLTFLAIAGDVAGGLGSSSGAVEVDGTLSIGYIGGSIYGGNNGYVAGDGVHVLGNDVWGSGYVHAARLPYLKVMGSLFAGVDVDGGNGPHKLYNSGAIRAEVDIGTLWIQGDVIGSNTDFGNQFAVISAGGFTAFPAPANAIQTLIVGGSTNFAQIAAGYVASGSSKLGSAVNSAAGIGAIAIGQNMSNTDIIAGVIAGADGYFGTADDRPIEDNVANGYATIGSLAVGGQVYNDVWSFQNPISFGVSAAHVSKVTINGSEVILNDGYSNDATPLGLTGGTNLFEVPLI